MTPNQRHTAPPGRAVDPDPRRRWPHGAYRCHRPCMRRARLAWSRDAHERQAALSLGLVESAADEGEERRSRTWLRARPPERHLDLSAVKRSAWAARGRSRQRPVPRWSSTSAGATARGAAAAHGASCDSGTSAPRTAGTRLRRSLRIRWTRCGVWRLVKPWDPIAARRLLRTLSNY